MITEAPYLPVEVSELFPDHISQTFWDRCRAHELVFQRCSSCQTFRHPPGPICYVCRSADAEWVAVEGSGTVFTYTVVTHGVHPALSESLPFNVVLVEFPDAPGVRLVSNVIDATPDQLKSGMAVALAWQDLPNGSSLPRFQRA
jgi:uncharacterized OB-fold protein